QPDARAGCALSRRARRAHPRLRSRLVRRAAHRHGTPLLRLHRRRRQLLRRRHRVVVSFAEALRFWLKLGFISFGGPAGQIAIMHHELVERRRWISETRFLHALNYCMLLPGPEAQQLATYIGWLLHRTWGGIVAGGLFVLPGVLVMLMLSWLYVRYASLGPVAALFFGLKAAVLAVVVEAVLRIGRRALRNGFMVAI